MQKKIDWVVLLGFLLLAGLLIFQFSTSIRCNSCPDPVFLTDPSAVPSDVPYIYDDSK